NRYSMITLRNQLNLLFVFNRCTFLANVRSFGFLPNRESVEIQFGAKATVLILRATRETCETSGAILNSCSYLLFLLCPSGTPDGSRTPASRSRGQLIPIAAGGLCFNRIQFRGPKGNGFDTARAHFAP